jgi:hypothetical protein
MKLYLVSNVTKISFHVLYRCLSFVLLGRNHGKLMYIYQTAPICLIPQQVKPLVTLHHC